MAESILMAKRINNGQSELWLEAMPTRLRVVATNCIVYPIRTQCSSETSEEFHKAFAIGAAVVPPGVADLLLSEFALES